MISWDYFANDPTVVTSTAQQGQRAADQLRILNGELSTATSPTDIASLGREITRASSAFDKFKTLAGQIFDTSKTGPVDYSPINDRVIRRADGSIVDNDEPSILNPLSYVKKYGSSILAMVIGIVLLAGALYIYGTKNG